MLIVCRVRKDGSDENSIEVRVSVSIGTCDPDAEIEVDANIGLLNGLTGALDDVLLVDGVNVDVIISETYKFVTDGVTVDAIISETIFSVNDDCCDEVITLTDVYVKLVLDVVGTVDDETNKVFLDTLVDCASFGIAVYSKVDDVLTDNRADTDVCENGTITPDDELTLIITEEIL